jgi:hypothetical protein
LIIARFRVSTGARDETSHQISFLEGSQLAFMPFGWSGN